MACIIPYPFVFEWSSLFCVGGNKTVEIQHTDVELMVCCCTLKHLMIFCYFSLGIQEFPENIKNCKVLAIVEASVNPISK